MEILYLALCDILIGVIVTIFMTWLQGHIPFHSYINDNNLNDGDNRFFRYVAALITGGLIGYASLHLHDTAFIPSIFWRIGIVFVVPALAGGVWFAMAFKSMDRNLNSDPASSFWRGYWLAFGYLTVRFIGVLL